MLPTTTTNSPSPVITALAPDPRRPGAVRISARDLTWTIAAADVVTSGAGVGVVVDAALRDALERLADVEAAYRTALRGLGQRAFARHDLSRRLVRKGQPAPAVEAALERLVAQGLLDDAAFALQYVETRSTRGRGPARLRRDLAAMGVARIHVDAALAAVWAEGDADARALELALRRAAQLKNLPRLARRRRLVAFLARRGFTGEVATSAIRQAVGQ
jgi:regulatory protein